MTERASQSEMENKIIADVADLTARVNRLQKIITDREVNDLISRAIALGRITIHSRTFYEEIGQQEDGLEKLKDFFQRQPVIIPVPGIPSAIAALPKLTDCEKKLCEQLGITEEQYLAKTGRNG